MALLTTPPLELNQDPPDFSLPGVDGKTHSLSDFPVGTPMIIMFICNHCPYVKAIEDRLIQLAHDCARLKVPVIGISANDPIDYPEDSFSEMKVRAEKKNYPFLYLFDESQEVARAYGAVCTPDFFVYDRAHKLAYRGRLDDSWKDPTQVTRRELWEAVQMLSAPQSTGTALTNQKPSMGCSIKWKKANPSC